MLEAPRRPSCTTRRSTSGRTDGELPGPRGRRDRRARSFPAAASSFADDAGPDTRNYRVNCEQARRDVPRVRAQVDGAARRASSCYDAFHAQRARRARRSTSPRFQRIAHVRELLDAGRLDADLRWRRAHGRRTCRCRERRRPCRSCGSRRPRARSSRSATTPLADALVRPGATSTAGDALPARRRVLPRLLARADPRGGSGGASCSSTTTSTSRRSPTRCSPQLAQTRAAARSPSAGSVRRASSSRSRATTATCCKNFAELGVPGARHRPRARSGRGRRTRPASRRSREFFGVGARAPSCVAERQARRRDHRQQRHGARPRPQRLRRRHARAARRRRRRRRSRTPTCATSSTTSSSTRSTTSTSATSRAPRSTGSMRRHGLHAEPRRVLPEAARRHAALVDLSRDEHASSAAARRAASSRARASGSTRSTYYARFGGQRVEHVRERAASRCSTELAARRQRGSPRTARRPRARRCSTTSGSAPTSSSSSSTATCTSRAA